MNRLQKSFDQISGPVVLTCWQYKVATGSKEKEKFVGLLTVLFSVVMFLISFVLKRFGNAFVLLADYDPSKFRSPCKTGIFSQNTLCYHLF